MSKFSKDLFRSNPVILSALLIVLGLILAIWPGATLNTALRIISIGLLIGGVSSLLGWYKNRESTTPVDGGLGALMAIGGLVLLIRPSLVTNLIPRLIGLGVIFNGLINLFKALDLKKSGYQGWTGAMVMAVITLVAGVIVFSNPAWMVNNIVRIVGLVLIYNGATSLFISTRNA